MKARKIYLRSHSDALVGTATTETKAVIVGVLTAGSPKQPISYDDMLKGVPILDALKTPDGGEVQAYICIAEDQWTFLAQKVKAFPFATGGRGMLNAIQDIINAETIDMAEKAAEAINVDERETNP